MPLWTSSRPRAGESTVTCPRSPFRGPWRCTDHAASQVEGYIADITKPEVVRAAFDQCVKSFGVPDVVYANAGVAANDKIDFDDLGMFGRGLKWPFASLMDPR